MKKLHDKFITLKDFDKSFSELYRHGGARQKFAEKIKSILGGFWMGQPPFHGVPRTKHGESRIRHCRKYDFGNGFRLITIQAGGCHVFCYAGDHDECDKWLDANNGLEIAIEDGILVQGFRSPSAADHIVRPPQPSEENLIDRLENQRLDELLANLQHSVIAKIYQFGEVTTVNEICEICSAISDETQRGFVQDVLIHLSNGDIENAVRRLDMENGRTRTLENTSDTDLLEVLDGDEIRQIEIGSQEHAEWLERFAKKSKFLDWLLFMHPEQDAVVKEDFLGPARLSGVSGSGKTCVAVKRALRLARASKKAKILIITLNKSLAGLIQYLVNEADGADGYAQQIEVQSFFGLCQKMLQTFEPENTRLYNDITWKTDEHIDEVFREYYRNWNNSDAAKILLPVHISLTSQKVDAEVYLREEFDWVRSAIIYSERERYLDLERAGRKYPIQKNWRENILKGIEGWEEKMRFVGVIDYLGLTTSISKHISDVEPAYDHIIIDEAQDFGTTELAVLRKLVPERENDIFLCGDICQHVLPKHRSLAQAGIVTSGRSRRIVRNYRNSRQILKAAYKVLTENLDEDLVDDADLEILDPEFANRSSPKPVVLQAKNLSEEIGYARSLIADHLESRPDDRCCIAFAGYSMREIQPWAQKLQLPTLDGTFKANQKSQIVVSDLEQTKGYEFNIVVLVNCCHTILPPISAPEEEAFRHGCRLYVTMTRARDELYLSYHGSASRWLEAAQSELSFIEWGDVVHLREELAIQGPVHLSDLEGGLSEEKYTYPAGHYRNLTGRQFLYSRHAKGLSAEAMQKLDELVDGHGLARDGKRQMWRNIGAAADDLESHPHARALFGPSVQAEIRKHFAEKMLVIKRS